MDQSEIDALMKAAGAKPAGKGKKPAAPVPAPTPPAPPPAEAPAAKVAPSKEEAKPDQGGHVITEIDVVTEVTERETNKVMDRLDLISQLVGKQQTLISGVMKHPGAQDPSVQQAIFQIMSSGKEIQDKVFEAMDLMQFQDITRQKLERIVYHLRQIHDYIVELLGTGLKSETHRASISRTIAQTGTTPDEKKAIADSVVEEFMRSQKKD
jgi:hypothetical protein